MFGKFFSACKSAMSAERASACTAAASFSCANSSDAFVMDAALSASIFVISLLALGLRLLAILVVLAVLLRIMVPDWKMPKSRV